MCSNSSGIEKFTKFPECDFPTSKQGPNIGHASKYQINLIQNDCSTTTGWHITNIL